MTPDQIEIERKAWLSWFANRGPNEPGTSCDAWLARAEKAQRVREALEDLMNSDAAREIFPHLDKGIGIATAEGKRWLAARTALKD